MCECNYRPHRSSQFPLSLSLSLSLASFVLVTSNRHQQHSQNRILDAYIYNNDNHIWSRLYASKENSMQLSFDVVWVWHTLLSQHIKKHQCGWLITYLLWPLIYP